MAQKGQPSLVKDLHITLALTDKMNADLVDRSSHLGVDRQELIRLLIANYLYGKETI